MRKNFNNFIYLFLTALSLHRCTGLSFVVESGGYSLVALPRFLTAMASLAVEHGAQRYTALSNWGAWASVVVAHGLSSCGSQPGSITVACGPMWHVRSSMIRDRTHVSCVGRWVLYHWATRETSKRHWERLQLILGVNLDDGLYCNHMKRPNVSEVRFLLICLFFFLHLLLLGHS